MTQFNHWTQQILHSSSSIVQSPSESDCRRRFHSLYRYLMAYERPDVADAVSAETRDVSSRQGRVYRPTHRIIVGLSSPIPHPWTCTSLGNPIGSSISGRNIPLLPTSTHLPSCGWKAKISRDG